MRAVQVAKPKATLELVERPVPQPGRGEVRVKVQACGVCHSDSVTKEGLFPNITYPRVPGHEIAGVIDALGAEVPDWRVGDRVGIGWYAGHCGHCEACRRGKHILCQNLEISGLTRDGGYADYVMARFQALARLPEELSPVDAAPLLCAGITTYNALRESGARPGDLVAVHGIGGLGHLGVQFAARMGFRTAAIARGKDKEPLAKKLGAKYYIDSDTEDAAAALQRLGGAQVILTTATSGKAVSATIGGLAIDGKLVVVGAPLDAVEVNMVPMIMGRRSIQGWPSGTAKDSEDTVSFSAQAGVRPMNEVYPLGRAAEAYDRMMSGAARFRVVITTGN
jgi:D-arabinose 1-dehydrogenase-like Zn-dependent alcohol dehydrogenase